MNGLARISNVPNSLPTQNQVADTEISDSPTARHFSIPVVIADQDEAGRRAYTRVRAINGGTVSLSDDGLLLVTDSRQWACSAEAEIDLRDNRRSHTIVLELKVEEGQLGVGWMLPDGSRWVSRASA